MRLASLVVLFLCLFASAEADETYYGNIEKILDNKCVVCHRPNGQNMGGMVAPMSFLTYEDTRPWVKSIAKAVKNGTMPPWHADPAFDGQFQNERKLSSAEITAIANWANTGAKAGDPKETTPKREWNVQEWALGVPDMVLEMPKEFIVKDEIEDLYQNFIVDIPLQEPKWVSAIEFKPGSAVVHHIIGYVSEKGKPADQTRGMIGGIAPGNDPDSFPDGYGYRLNPGSKFLFQMHYHKEAGPGTAVPDKSKVAFKFYPSGKTDIKQIIVEGIDNHDFTIPPQHPNWEVGMSKTFERDATLLYMLPHMHLRGKDARYTAYYPDGSKEDLLFVPRYDFNWQTSYKYKEFKKIPAGTRIEGVMHFDNSENNPANPDPTKAIRFGPDTKSEMAISWVTYYEEVN